LIVDGYFFVTGTDDFCDVIQFTLPLGRAKALGQQTSLLLGIDPEAMNKTSGKKNQGVTCPQIK
jgi:hypothetical protein